MLFNSYIFLFAFLPLCLAGFAFLTARGHGRAALLWLLAMSLIFYGWWNPIYLFLLLSSVVANFVIGGALSRATRSGMPSPQILFAGLAFNIGLIIWFKYLGFFAGIFDAVSGSSIGFIDVALPLAISFFTFQQIAYLVDCHRGQAGETDFFKYALFVTFFPQLIAGPIVHHSEVMQQYERAFGQKLKSINVIIGLTLIAAGLFKKVVLADHLALYASPVFADAEAGGVLSFARAWSGTLAYTLQIYFDFSGYSDMAVGLARLFGVKLPINFSSPYRATSIIDFWRRWHITLSRFLRDYLYLPLGGNRKGPTRRHMNLLVTMLLGGLWHGAGWTFIVWGGLHGFYLVINHGWRRFSAGWGWTGASIIMRCVGWSMTFIAVSIAWVFFRADTFDGALVVLTGLSGVNDIWPILGLIEMAMLDEQPTGGRAWKWIVVGMVVAVMLPNIYQLMRAYAPALNIPGAPVPRRYPWRPTMPWAIGAGVLALIAFLMLTHVSEFLYFRF